MEIKKKLSFICALQLLLITLHSIYFVVKSSPTDILSIIAYAVIAALLIVGLSMVRRGHSKRQLRLGVWILYIVGFLQLLPLRHYFTNTTFDSFAQITMWLSILCGIFIVYTSRMLYVEQSGYTRTTLEEESDVEGEGEVPQRLMSVESGLGDAVQVQVDKSIKIKEEEEKEKSADSVDGTTEDTDTPLKYIALHNFPGSVAGELPLKVGDEVIVIEEDSSGWYRGRNSRTDEVGLFPINFCERV